MRMAKSIQAKYEELIRRCKEIALLSSCSEMLNWDEETYMPPRGVEHRGRQLALLVGLRHERLVDPRLGELLDVLEDSSLVDEPNSPEAANIREVRRAFDRKRKLPRELLEEMVRVTTTAQREWSVAYRSSDFASFRPWLQKIVALKRREAEALERGGSLYDALLEDYEPGARSESLEQMFSALKTELRPLIDKIAESEIQPDKEILRREFPVDTQRSFCRAVAEGLGFDFNSGRIDETVHPFCASIGAGDTRIATRYSARDFNQGLFAVIHEVGHAFYEQGLDPAHDGTPAGTTASLGVHESQSRLWENLVGRSIAFWQHFFPLAKKAYGAALRNVSLRDFHLAINCVSPSFVRAEADEVTYNLHVLIRFELERALLNGHLEIEDLPDAWSASYERNLGIVPSNDREGCLQDGHWASGLFGYFPTYTLGNLIAAQLFARARSEMGDLTSRFSQGDFSGLLGWLRENIHRQGRVYSANQLIEKVTGSPPGPRPFIEMLEQKYGELYGF